MAKNSEQEGNRKLKGRIKRLHIDKGFGFIESGGQDYFFHRTGLQLSTVGFNDLREDMTVEFLEVESPKGPRAAEIRVL